METQTEKRDVSRFTKRYGLKPVFDEDFYQYILRNRSTRIFPHYPRYTGVRSGVMQILKIVRDMTLEAEHGVHLKGIGVIVPRGTIIYLDDTVFAKKQTVKNTFKLYFEKEYVSSEFKAFLTIKGNKPKKERSVNPYTILTHRKKVKKNAKSNF